MTSPQDNLPDNSGSLGRTCGRASPEVDPDAVARLRDAGGRFLTLLERHDTRITFFVTGQVFECLPELVERMRANGHEIGWHGHSHKRISDAAILDQELHDSKAFLETYRPAGFRAPWAYFPPELLPRLAAAGFKYDSSALASPGEFAIVGGVSVLPVTSLAIWPGARRLHSARIGPGTLWRRLPIGIGIVVSLLRLAYHPILRFLSWRRRSCIFYLHLWQMYQRDDTRFTGVRSIHNFPMAGYVESWLSRHHFARLGDLHEHRLAADGRAHFLTVDVEL